MLSPTFPTAGSLRGSAVSLCGTEGPWNQFHRCDLGTRAGGWELSTQAAARAHDDPPWPRFVGGAFFVVGLVGQSYFSLLSH